MTTTRRKTTRRRNTTKKIRSQRRFRKPRLNHPVAVRPLPLALPHPSKRISATKQTCLSLNQQSVAVRPLPLALPHPRKLSRSCRQIQAIAVEP